MSKTEDLSYVVVWHCPNPKMYFAGYNLKDAEALAEKIRRKHAVFLITINKEMTNAEETEQLKKEA